MSDAATPLGADTDTDDAMFGALADHLPTLCWAAHADGYIFWYNRRWYDYTGTTAAAMAGWGWQSVHDPARLPEVLERWTAAIRHGTAFEMVFPLRAADGSFRPFLTRVSPHRDAAGAVVRWYGVNTDIAPQIAAETALRDAADSNALLTQELSHRIKNIFAIVAGMISLSVSDAPAQRDFARQLSERIAALGRAHDFARPHSAASQSNGGSQLHALLRQLFAPYAADCGERIIVSGDDLAVDALVVTPLALTFHELATNAMKYGALSVTAGRVDVATRLEHGQLTLTWCERSGPAVTAAPASTGFGTRLTAIAIERQLGGTIAHEWQAHGLVVRISLDASRVTL